MPIYMKIDGIRGDVTPAGPFAGGASGGIWKTTNFLTTDPASVIELRSISTGTIELRANDPMPTVKAVQLFNAARNGGPNGKLYLATEVGVFQRASDPRTRLLVGTDQGIWRSGPGIGKLRSLDSGRTWRSSPAKLNHTNNLRQIGLAALNYPAVEILVVNPGESRARSFILRNVKVTPAPRAGGDSVPTTTVTMNFAKIDF